MTFGRVKAMVFAGDAVMPDDFAVDLERIARQERELQFAVFDASTAWKLGCRLREMAMARRAPVVIDIRKFGHTFFYCALEGTAPDNAAWVERKVNVVARFLRSSYAMGLTMRRDGTTLMERFGLPLSEWAAHGGAFPLSVVNAGVIGSVTVSGLPQRVDHELVVEALCAELGREYAELALSL